MAQKGNFICKVCGRSFIRYIYPNQNIVCCSKKCQGKYYSVELIGSNNPNYGKHWSKEKRLLQSQRTKQQMKDPKRRYQSGSANRGKKFSQERIRKMHENRTYESYCHPPSEEMKKIIGIKSKQKFLKPNYWKNVRKKFEDNGYWIPLKNKTKYQIYMQMSNWPKRMFDYLSNKMKNQISIYGIFHYSKNINGLVRDHIFSRKDGFNLGVFPEILRHPCNCQLLFLIDNIKKKSKSYITIDELFNKIKNYKGKWPEHNICLELIQKYESGKRFVIDLKDSYLIDLYYNKYRDIWKMEE